MSKYWKFFVSAASAFTLSVGLAYAGVNQLTGSRVSVSSDTANPTLIIATDMQRKGLTIVNYNSDATHFILLDEASSGFSTSSSTGTSRLGPSSSITLDGPIEPYVGAIYGVSGASIALTVDVFPVK